MGLLPGDGAKSQCHRDARITWFRLAGAKNQSMQVLICPDSETGRDLQDTVERRVVGSNKPLSTGFFPYLTIFRESLSWNPYLSPTPRKR